jgi:hypothetical protein
MSAWQSTSDGRNFGPSLPSLRPSASASGISRVSVCTASLNRSASSACIIGCTSFGVSG